MNIEDNTTKLVLEECHKLEEILNKTLLPEFAKFHRADPKYCHLQLKQEVLAETSIFFTKKKYGLFIINKEGKKVSEYEIKGMITRRSNFPAYSKEKVTTLMDMILKEEKINIQKIKKFIIDTEIEVIDMCRSHSKLIAGAVSFTKPVEEYKNNRIPYQVRGMLLWNALEYKYFIPGTKGYLYRIKGIDTLKAPERIINNMKGNYGAQNKHIVIPYEEDQLPEYYSLDMSSQMEFVWTDRVKEVVDVLLPRNESLFEQNAPILF